MEDTSNLFTINSKHCRQLLQKFTIYFRDKLVKEGLMEKVGFLSGS